MDVCVFNVCGRVLVCVFICMYTCVCVLVCWCSGGVLQGSFLSDRWIIVI